MTKALNQAVKRNPQDFMLQLAREEKQEVVTSCDHLAKLKFSNTLPFAFTEHGAIQAANVLATKQAVEMGIYVVPAFVRLRVLLASNKQLAQRLYDLERKIEQKLASHDQAIAGLITTIRQLMSPPTPPKRPIGFVTSEEQPTSLKPIRQK